MSVMDANERKKVEDALMRKAEDFVRRMRNAADNGLLDQVEMYAAAMTELLKSKDFPSVRASEFREISKAVQCAAYERSVDSLLTQAERCGHQGDDKGRNEWLTKAKDHFGKSIRMGADEDFRHAVERRVQATLMTSKDGVDDRTKQANARKLEQHDVGAKPPNGIERRRAIRYMDPPLSVQIDDRRYTTVNWSTRGLMIEVPAMEMDLHPPGSRVKLELRCAEVPEHGGRQPAQVVRVDPDHHTMAVNFPDISTVVLDLAHAMKDAGIKPEPER